MKQSLNQVLNFVKNHKYGWLSVSLLLLGLAISSAMLFSSIMKEKPVALSAVATAISDGRVVRIEELQGGDTLIIHYKDGTQDTTRRDPSTSFLEQMQFLGVSRSQMAKLEYEVVVSNMVTSDKAISTLVSIPMLGLMAFAVTRMGGGIIGRKKFVEGAIPNINFNDVAGMYENREELVDIVAFLKNNVIIR
jgi:ATP-dependent Zn protease